MRRVPFCVPFALSSSRGGSASFQKRSIIIPKQLKAYGGTFSRQDRGERKIDLPIPLLQNVTTLYNHAPAIRRTAMIDAFSEMSLDASVRASLNETFAISEPSPIQQLTIPVITERNVAVVVASPSGTGKTLSCLAPAYSNMVKDRDLYKLPTREFRPRMIVLAPTREILKQTGHVCEKLDKETGMRSVAITRMLKMKSKLKKLLRKGDPIDVVVMHPQMVLKLVRCRRLFLDDLRYLVVDEADEMLSRGQDYATQHLIAKIQKRILFKHLPSVETQIIFSTSNITRRVSTYINRKFPYAVHCVTKDAHKAPENIKFRFYPCKNAPQKMEILEFVLNKKTHNYPLLTMSTDEDVARIKSGSVNLEGASVVDTCSESTGKPPGLRGNEADEDISYKDWLNERVVAGSFSDPSESDLQIKSEEKALSSVDRLSSSAALVTSSFATRDVSAASASTFVPSDKTFPKSVSVSKRDLETRSRLRTEVSKALMIPTTRRYGSAALVRPAVRWQNVLTHAAPFQFHIPQTFIPQSGLRVMIFMRGIDACAAIYFKLRELGYGVSLLHASLPETVRNEMLQKFASGQVNILCCTNVMARGVDIPVDVVINFDLPSDAGTFLNRAGRCGRMGRPGTCYSLVHAKKDRVMASALDALIHSGVGLHGVSNDKTHMNRPRYSEWSTHHKNQLSRAYVSLISKSVIPRALVKSYIRHNAMWRPLYHPNSAHHHGGVDPRQQERIMAAIRFDAVAYRKEQLAKRKGGRAKFGGVLVERTPWSWKGAAHTEKVGNSFGSDAVANSVTAPES